MYVEHLPYTLMLWVRIPTSFFLFFFLTKWLASFFFVFFSKIFSMWTIFKVFIEFVTILLLFFNFWFFGYKACEILAPRPGIEPVPPAFEGEVLTTGLPGKSLATFNICSSDRLKLCVRRNREGPFCSLLYP